MTVVFQHCILVDFYFVKLDVGEFLDAQDQIHVVLADNREG